MNKDLIIAVANKVSDENSIILFDIANKNYSKEKEDIVYALCLRMLEELEGEEE